MKYKYDIYLIYVVQHRIV